jgi:hypothetical protein
MGFHIEIKYLNSTEIIRITGVGGSSYSDTMITSHGMASGLTPGQFYQV